MANEITLNGSLSVFKPSIMAQAAGFSVNNFIASMGGTTWDQGTVLIGTGPTRIPLSQVYTPHWACFLNTDPTNFVNLFYNNTGLAYSFIQLNAGEPCFVPINPAAISPVAQVTVAPGGSGGSLGAGTYVAAITGVTAGSLESSIGASQSANFTVTTGQEPVVTLPALSGQFTSFNLYCSDTTQANLRRYATAITAGTYTMTASLPSLGSGNPPPPLTNPIGPYAQANTAPISLQYAIFSL